jgi:tetratricopeptide (TPR) repeat protein
MTSRSLPAALLLLTMTACGGLRSPEVRPVPLATSEPRQTPFDAAYDEGKRHLAADRLGLAIVMFDKALAINPRSVIALNACGVAYDDLHRYPIAHGYYRRALQIEPNNTDTWNNMAVSAMMAQDFETARTYLAKASSLDPDNEIVRNNMRLLAHATAPIIQLTDLGDDDDLSHPTVERTGSNELTLVVHPLRRPKSLSLDEKERLFDQFRRWAALPAGNVEKPAMAKNASGSRDQSENPQ